VLKTWAGPAMSIIWTPLNANIKTSFGGRFCRLFDIYTLPIMNEIYIHVCEANGSVKFLSGETDEANTA
jgi:hypothetical protein